MIQFKQMMFLAVSILLIILPHASRGSWEVINDDDVSNPDDVTLGDDDFFNVEKQQQRRQIMQSRHVDPKQHHDSSLTTDQAKNHGTSESKMDAVVQKAKSQNEANDLDGFFPKVEVYGDDDDDAEVRHMDAMDAAVDCNDHRFISSIDCLTMSSIDGNLSQDGVKARQELLGFMELNRQKRQSGNQDDTLFDEGSGGGEVYPTGTGITNASYVIESTITFNISVIDDTVKSELERQLSAAYANISGVSGVNVTDIRIENGTLVATYDVVISGASVSGYGSDLQSIKDRLKDSLQNVTGPAYDVIVLQGKNPLAPFSPDTFVDSVAEKLNNICSTVDACPRGFDNCTATGFDEGQCVHLCVIFELDGQCEHGGLCELNENVTPFCSCPDNWKGNRCQEAVRSNELDSGEIGGAIVGATLAVIGLVGCCCWLLLCRRKRDMGMTHFSDDAAGSDVYSNPSSKIYTFVIDRPRISTSPVNAFNPGNMSSPYTHSSKSIFSDA